MDELKELSDTFNTQLDILEKNIYELRTLFSTEITKAKDMMVLQGIKELSNRLALIEARLPEIEVEED